MPLSSSPMINREEIIELLEEALQRRRGTLVFVTHDRTFLRRLATLEVRRSNAAAIALYQGLGYRQVGMRPRYYAEENEDALLMSMDLA